MPWFIPSDSLHGCSNELQKLFRGIQPSSHEIDGLVKGLVGSAVVVELCREFLLQCWNKEAFQELFEAYKHNYKSGGCVEVLS